MLSIQGRIHWGRKGLDQAAMGQKRPRSSVRASRRQFSKGKLFWREVGQGEALIFLHGSWQESSQWLPLMERLGSDFHCLAPDLLGFGDSEKPEHHYSIALEVECLAEYLETLGLQRVYLVGHSLGGWIATSFALKHWEQVQGLVLIAPEGVEPSDLSGRWLGFRLLWGRVSAIASLLKRLRPVAKFIGLHRPLQRSLQWRQNLLQSPVAAQLLFQRRRAERTAELLQEQLPWLKVPALVLYGTQDAKAEKLLAQTYAELIPDATLEALPGTSQDLVEAQADQVVERLQTWLQAR